MIIFHDPRITECSALSLNLSLKFTLNIGSNLFARDFLNIATSFQFFEVVLPF